MYLYQKSGRYFAQVADDLKELAIDELGKMGAVDIGPVFRGIYFTCPLETLYKINFSNRFISRILAPIAEFDCHSDRYLYQRITKINWSDFLKPELTFSVAATVHDSNIKHSQFAALRVKDGIVDYYSRNTGRRPSVDRHNPDLSVNLFLNRNKALVSIDTSGGALHRRGYRSAAGTAPMQETLAAAIIEYSEWDGESPFYDPMCGSGTLLCEAYLKATHLPPGVLRKKWGFECLPDFKQEDWSKIKKEALQQVSPTTEGLIAGSDIDREIVNVARKNIRRLDQESSIAVKQRDIFNLDGIVNTTIVCNPPYGVRMGKDEDLSLFYQQLGDFLKQHCNGSTAYIYFGEREYIKKLGLRSSWKKAFNNGGLDGRLVKYELY